MSFENDEIYMLKTIRNVKSFSFTSNKVTMSLWVQKQNKQKVDTVFFSGRRTMFT